MSGRITPAEIADAGFAPRPGWAPATGLAYATDWRQFAVWCDVRGVIALPCSADTLTTYLSDLARSGLKAGTIARRAAAIAQRHRIAGLEPTSQEAVKTVKRGIRRMHGTVTVRKAATADIVAAMLDVCTDTLAGIRDRALVSFGYGAALSRPRLVALTLADLPQRSRTIPPLHPAKHMRAWLAAAGITEGRVFRSVISGHVGEAMTGFAISKRVKLLAKRAGHDPATFSASSLRAGFLLDHRLPRLDAGR